MEKTVMDNSNTTIQLLPNNNQRAPADLSSSPLLNTYIQAATSQNTRKAYRQDIQHFIAWRGLLPTTSDTVVRYLHEYAETLNGPM